MIFLLIAVLVVAAIHGYLWYRLCASTSARGSRLRRIGGWTLTGLAALAVSAVTIARIEALPELLRHLLQWLGYPWIALMFYLLVWLLPWELLRPLLTWLARRHAPTRPPDGGSLEMADSAVADRDEMIGPDRRVALSRGIAALAGVGAVTTVGYGAFEALGAPEVERVSIPLRKLDPALTGFRIGLVSDIHVGAFAGRSRVRQIVRELNRQRVDLVAIVGDLIDGSVLELGSDVMPLRGLTAPHGSYFVTGNHEYYAGVEQWAEFLPTLGITVLANRRVEISRNGAGFDVAGVNDVSADAETHGRYGSDLDEALRGRDPSRPVVLLAHQPVMFDDAVAAGVDLQLSGHTHGGQLAPFGLLVKAQQGIVSGYARRGDSQLYVTRGTGSWGPPVRVGAPPEITVVRLEPAY